jgi:hypothetical protein
MGIRSLTAFWLVLALLLIGTASSQGMGDRRSVTGPPVVSQESSIPDYLSPSSAGIPEWDPYGPNPYPQPERPEWDPYGPNGYGAYNLQIEPQDPVSKGIAIKDEVRIPNQLYLQRVSELVTEGGVLLGEPYTLWARVAGKGSLTLYDRNSLVLNQGYVTPGWYRITGAYADFLGTHLYRFSSEGQASNNLSILVDSGGYPTSHSLTGRVLDESGKGMRGVRVILSNNEGGRFSTITDASGYYGFDVSAGIYLINAELGGYTFAPTTASVWTGVVSAAKPMVGHLLSPGHP